MVESQQHAELRLKGADTDDFIYKKFEWTKLVCSIRQWISECRVRVERLAAKGHQETLGADGNVLHLDWMVYIRQNSPNFTLKMGAFYYM